MVVTFGGQPSKRTPSGFGTGFALANDWDTIYVAQAPGTQYQGLSREAFRDALAPIAEGRDVVCYGSSLGAYAALYFGGTLDARIIAAAPMLPAWPPLQRPPQDQMELRHGWMADGPLSSKSPVVLYDPEVKHDQMMLDGMVRPAYPELRVLSLPYAGHTVLQYLKTAGLLARIIRRLVNDDTLGTHDFPTHDNAIWLFNRGRALRNSDPDEAVRMLQLAFEKERSRHIYGNLVGLLLRLDRIDDLKHLLAATRDDDRMTLPKGTMERVQALGIS